MNFKIICIFGVLLYASAVHCAPACNSEDADFGDNVKCHLKSTGSYLKEGISKIGDSIQDAYAKVKSKITGTPMKEEDIDVRTAIVQEIPKALDDEKSSSSAGDKSFVMDGKSIMIAENRKLFGTDNDDDRPILSVMPLQKNDEKATDKISDVVSETAGINSEPITVPISIDDRSIFDVPARECPDGQLLVKNRCRPIF